MIMQGHRTAAGRSVLDELGLDAGYVVKAKLALRIQRSIDEMGLSQREAAKRMPISQPKLSLLTRGKLNDISQTKLEECLRALGHDIEIAISARHEGVGKVKVRELA
jgi:predicted XRE-type DNA-binding protein